MIHDTRTETRWFMTKSMNTWHVLGTGDRALCRANIRPYSHTFSEAGKAAWCIPTPTCLACSRKLEALQAQPAQPAGPEFVADAANPADAELTAAIDRGIANGTLVTVEDFLAADPEYVAAQAEHDAAGPDHATWCAGPSAHLVVLPELDDASRTVEIVSGEGIAWEATGRASQVALWLGNATEHDREAIRTLARQVARTGRALRITFGSVLPFYMGATEYGGRTLYRIFVPSITTQVAPVVLGPMHFHPVHVSEIVSGDVIDLQRLATGETYYAALTASVRDNPGPRLTPAGWRVNFAGGGSWLVSHDTELRIANRADAVTRARLAELEL